MALLPQSVCSVFSVVAILLPIFSLEKVSGWFIGIPWFPFSLIGWHNYSYPPFSNWVTCQSGFKLVWLVLVVWTGWMWFNKGVSKLYTGDKQLLPNHKTEERSGATRRGLVVQVVFVCHQYTTPSEVSFDKFLIFMPFTWIKRQTSIKDDEVVLLKMMKPTECEILTRRINTWKIKPHFGLGAIQ